jgi:single-stranded DNA-binding protein
MINAIVSGNIGSAKLVKKPEFTVLDFTVASNSTTKGGKTVTNWVTGKLWGPRAISLAPYLVKGKTVLIEGRPEAVGYAGKDGVKGNLVVHVTNFEFVGPKPKSAPSSVEGEDSHA